MTPNQRKAIEILNRIKSEKHLNEDDYFFLMDFIMKDSQVTYIPYIQSPYIDTLRPLEPYYEFRTTCKE